MIIPLPLGRGCRLVILFFFTTIVGWSQQEEVYKPVTYTSKGFQFETRDERFRLQLESRFQFRYATPQDQDPLTFDDFTEEKRNVFKINRARLKVGGHAYRPWLKYYFEYELAQSRLLDFRVMIEKWDFFNVKVGQWKTYYTRERVISSGKQQMVDRSIVNRPFTLDRQQGVELYGRLFSGTPVDFSYNLSVLTGTGRGATSNDDDKLLYVGRLQWNMLGDLVPFQGSDLEISEKPLGLLAVAGATNRSPYTRFSTAGGGQLEGFAEGIDGQYRIHQALLETAFMYKGFSWQHESHYKEIYDYVNSQTTILTGSYFQAGYFLHQLIEVIPEPLEVAGRYAWYRPNRDLSPARQEEKGFAVNWFFAGHRNKLTAEVTWFDLEGTTFPVNDEFRFRIQWDISF